MKPVLIILITGMLFAQTELAQAPTETATKGVGLEEVLAHSGQYVSTFYEDFTNILAEEQYFQFSIPSVGLHEKRTLWSDVLLVRAESADHYKLFRDVYKVDKKSVRDREDRLAKLFVESPATLEKIAAESTRYNIGALERNFNLPTSNLCFLEPRNQPRVSYSKDGEEQVRGVLAWKIGFREKTSPSIIRYNSGDIFACGTFWIDPTDGRVLKLKLVLESKTGRGVRVEMSETYAFNPTVSMMVPVEMTERYEYEKKIAESGEVKYGSSIECIATYTKFRKARVSTKIVYPDGEPQKIENQPPPQNSQSPKKKGH